jgi:hypothetical protein
VMRKRTSQPDLCENLLLDTVCCGKREFKASQVNDKPSKKRKETRRLSGL